MRPLGKPSVWVHVNIKLLTGMKTRFGFKGIIQLSMRMETGAVQNLYGNGQVVPSLHLKRLYDYYPCSLSVKLRKTSSKSTDSCRSSVRLHPFFTTT